ncbi:MAG: acyl-CoA reductase [Pseudomonadota bacterium]
MMDHSAIDRVLDAAPFPAFDDRIIAIFDALHQKIMAHPKARAFPDLAAFGFFVRARHLETLKQSYLADRTLLGRGLAFHIGPANVPLNFAYSLTASLLAGNPTIVRVSSKDFEQAGILVTLLNEALAQADLPDVAAVIQYDHTSDYNQILSKACDIRVVWGGDETIAFFKGIPTQPHATEIQFANRYSALLIDAAFYLEDCDPAETAQRVYNDIYPFDQQACTSPKLVFWLGNTDACSAAKARFWPALASLLTSSSYETKPGLGVRHFKSMAQMAARHDVAEAGAHLHPNLKVLNLGEAAAPVMPWSGSEGLFLQTDIEDLSALGRHLDHRCQTLSVIGDVKDDILRTMAAQGMKGIDRIAPVGSSANFSFIWEGKDLIHAMSRSFPR